MTVLSSPVQQIAAGPRQHSRSWFRAPSGPMTEFIFVPRQFTFGNGAPSSTRGRIRVLMVTPRLQGNVLLARNLTHSLSLSLSHPLLSMSHHQATTSEGMRDWEGLVCAVVICSVCTLVKVL
jgi:hypothetical protein